MKIGVLALQGAFIEHERVLNNLGVECYEIRKKEDLADKIDGIILPGGESTVMGKLLYDLDLFDEIKGRIGEGLPVLATCAGAILLAKDIEGSNRSYFGTIPMKIKRNAYGRQLGSFITQAEVTGIGLYPMHFIRAPYIVSVDSNVNVLSVVENRIVGIEFDNQLAFSFHPELTNDARIHKYFLKKCSVA